MSRGCRPILHYMALLTACAVIALLVVACGGSSSSSSGSGSGSSSSNNPTIRVVTAVDQFYAFIAIQEMKELGTFEGSGLNVQVVSGTTPTEGAIVAAGEAEIMLASAGGIAALQAQNLPVTMVASNLTPWDYVVIVSNKGKFAGAKSLPEMKGANFGITGKGSPGDYLLWENAQKLGWTRNDYKQTALGEVSSLFAALAAGRVDATLWAPDQGYISEQEGIATSFSIPNAPNVLQAFGIYDPFLKQYPEQIKTFFKYYFAEVKKLQENPQLFIDTMTKNWEMDPTVAAKLAKNDLKLISADGRISDAELKGLEVSVPVLIGKPDMAPPELRYLFWEDIK